MPGTSEEELAGADVMGALTQLSENLAGARPRVKAAEPAGLDQPIEPAGPAAVRVPDFASIAQCVPPAGTGYFSLLEPACSEEYREQFRLLRTQLMLHRARFERDQDFRTVCVMSTQKGEGKSFTASNLAAMLAVAGGQRVLLLDSDTGSAPLPIGVPLSEGAGLLYALSAPEDWPRTAYRVQGTPLYILPRAARNRARTLDLEPLPRLLGVLRQQFDWIIVDGAAFASCPDAPWLTAMADGTLLVVRENAASFGAVEESLTSIPPERLVGVVFNQSKSEPKVRLRVRMKIG